MDIAFGRRSVVGEIGGDGAPGTGGFTPAAEKYAVVAPIGQGGKRLLDESLSQLSAEDRASALANLRVNREVAAAAKAAGL